MNKRNTSRSPPPILALAVPVYGKGVKVRRKTNSKRKIVTGIFSATSDDGEAEKEVVPTSHTMIRRCRSELPLSKLGSSDVVFIENIVCARAKKKKKKKKKKTEKREVLLTSTWEENTNEENPFCYNDGGVCTQRLELFDNMVEAFRYSGNKRLQEPLDSCEFHHVSTANATFFSTFGTKPRTKKVRCRCKSTLTKEEKMKNCYRRVNADNAWVPPYSPYDLMQEDHSFDPWRVLVICMLLNQTTGGQVKKILRRVFLICPTAEAAVQAPEDDLRTIITSLGLQNKRVRDIREMSRQYLEDGWTHVTQLHGIGKYAADSYAIFCVGEPEDVVPNDHMLVKYWKFVVQWKCEQQRVMDYVDC